MEDKKPKKFTREYSKKNNYQNNNRRNSGEFVNKHKERLNSKYYSNIYSNNKDDIKIVMLGGMGEVGKNSYVLEILGDIFLIDYGVLFPSEEFVGVDYILPNFTYLKENEHRIKGFFITHGHEDHIGGLPFLLKKINIKQIYAPKMSRFLIEKKLKEHNLEAKIVEVNDFSEININNIKIHTFHQTHSIPNSLGLFFETPIGNVVTTGDFKVDFSPSGEKKTDFHRIAKLSNKGVKLLLADSTNSLKSGFSESSSEIGENLKILLREAEGRILFTTFASHINRVQKIIEGALEENRKICVLGRSMKNNIKIGTKAGYINIKPSDLIDIKSINNYEPHEVCIISTGSQGEELAALSRIASGLNPHIELSEEDTVVFASSPIPGNRYSIGKVIDKLYKTRCKVITNGSHFKTHTSGHASKEEQKLMLSLFKPEHFIPIHGNHHMLLAHKATAVEVGVNSNNIYILDNGDAVRMSKKDKPKIIRKHTNGNSMFVSGSNINVNLKGSNMNQIASDGLLIVSLLTTKSGKLVSYPQVTTRGFVIISEEIDLLKQIQKFVIKEYREEQDTNADKIKVSLAKKINNFINTKTGKDPFIDINIVNFKPEKSM